MLKPAILYKDIIEKRFAEQLYSDDYFWYTGYGTCTELPVIKSDGDGYYQWAIVRPKPKDMTEKEYYEKRDEYVIGYFAYRIHTETDTVCNFGLYSFDRGNIIIGFDVFNKMEELISEHRRMEWRMVGGNPIKKSYDKFCKRHNGHIAKLHQATKDIHGEYHDEYIYEILKEN